MQKKISTLPFKGTPEQEAKLREIIDAHKHDKSQLMAVMQQAQDVYGYLPVEVQAMIAEGMDVPLEKVYGVATFYAQFSLSPKGQYNISVCLGTACYVKGAQKLIDRVEKLTGAAVNKTSADGLFSLDATRCLGACGLAPVCIIDGKYYGNALVDSEFTNEIRRIVREEKKAGAKA